MTSTVQHASSPPPPPPPSKKDEGGMVSGVQKGLMRKVKGFLGWFDEGNTPLERTGRRVAFYALAIFGVPFLFYLFGGFSLDSLSDVSVSTLAMTGGVAVIVGAGIGRLAQDLSGSYRFQIARILKLALPILIGAAGAYLIKSGFEVAGLTPESFNMFTLGGILLAPLSIMALYKGLKSWNETGNSAYVSERVIELPDLAAGSRPKPPRVEEPETPPLRRRRASKKNAKKKTHSHDPALGLQVATHKLEEEAAKRQKAFSTPSGFSLAERD